METLSKKYSDIKGMIVERSPYDEKETNRILSKFFGSVPIAVKILTRNHGFDEKKVLDIGCSYGLTLLYWKEGSEGVEIQERLSKFVDSMGIKVHKLNVEEGFQGLKEGGYDAIYTHNLLEHLVAPHLFLMRLHKLLKPGGILAIGHPVVPPSPFRELLGLLGYKGWATVEHVNFFTAKTSKLTLERAGFEVMRQYRFRRLYRIPILRDIVGSIWVSCLSVCKKQEGFKYNKKRTAEFDPCWAAPDLKHFR
mgnify:CR=1 FL=1